MVKTENKPIVPLDDELKQEKIKPKKIKKNRALEIRKSIPADKALQWYQNEYSKQWAFDSMPNIKKTPIIKTSSSSFRMSNINTLKYTFNYNSMNQIVVVMKLYDHNLKKEANYGMLFCEFLDDIPPLRKKLYYPESIIGNIMFTFYSASPSYVSADGEYRGNFALYASILKVKKHFALLWNELDEYISKEKVKRNWALYTNYFYPDKEKKLNIEFAVKNQLIPETILIISWFYIIFSEYNHMYMMHINPDFKSIFLNYLKEDKAFLTGVIKKHTLKKIQQFHQTTTATVSRFFKSNNVMKNGYKMIPLNVKEVQDPLKLRYKPWREYFISAKLNDLIINSVSPTFAIILDWFYIQDSSKGLYDNQSQYDRMKHSELAKEILKNLYEAQRGTYFASENLLNINKSNGQVRKWINQKFKTLNKKITEPINYSVEELIMSDITLAFANEYVGRTFAESLNLLNSSKYLNKELGYPLEKKGYHHFAKYIFDVAYGLLCGNKRLGIIHGDLHLNNITIGSIYFTNDKINKKVVYVFDDDHQYVFPNNTYVSCIIDYSRGIILPDKFDIFRDKSLPRKQRLIDDKTKFEQLEIHSLLNLYIYLFPNKKKKYDELLVIFKKHTNAVFKLLTCIDLYMFTIRLTRLLSNLKHVYEKCFKLIDDINRLAEEYIATDMNHLINEPKIYDTKINNSEYPIETIIKKIFSEYNDGYVYKKIGTINDVYILNNKLKYSVDKYKDFPDIMKYVKYKKDNQLINSREVELKRRQNRAEYEKQKLHNLDTLTFLANQQIMDPIY